MKRTKRILSVILCLVMVFAIGSSMQMAAVNGGGIRNNGLGGINIDIYKYPYNDSRWGTYGDPYGAGGCTWFVGARVMELTGKGSFNTQVGNTWYYTYGPNLGFTSDQTPSGGSVICWSGHVAILEKIEGSTAYISEGGFTTYPSNDYCNLSTCNVSSIAGRNSGFIGYVHFGSYNSDTTNPSYDDFHVGEFQENQFTVMAHVTDESGIQSVRYAVWTDKNGQDDLVWYNGNHTDGNDYYWSRIPFAEHNGEKGRYTIHMYACDNAGNEISVGLSYIFPETGPTISNVQVTNVSSTGYTVTCNVSAAIGVSKVLFPTWTQKNGDDDKLADWKTNPKVRGTINGNLATFRVNASEHGNETGIYITTIYAYDLIGNYSTDMVFVNVHNHSYTSNITQAATCSATGVLTYTCSCGDSYTEPISKDSSNHVRTTNVAATTSTCTVKGYTAGVYCNDCKNYISGHAEQPLANHTISIINKQDATYDAEGYTGDEYCTVCKQTIKTGTVIPKIEKTDNSEPQQDGGCPWCGGTHNGFIGGIVGFFHRILAAIFGNKY